VGAWDKLLDRKPDLVLMPTNSPTHNLMRHQPGWVIVYEDSECFVAVPTGSAWETRIRSAQFDQSIPANGARLYFPE
jgi:hypothetical protein